MAVASLITALFSAGPFFNGTLAQERRGKKTVMTSTIAFVSTRHDPAGNLMTGSQIYLMNGDGTNVRRITENKFADNFPALSPDGRKIVFESNRLRTESEPFNISHLFLMETDGTGQTLLTRGSSASWSPDGRKILYTSHLVVDDKLDSPTAEIYVMNTDGKGRRGRLTNNSEEERAPAWSPDGKRILYMCRKGGPDFELCVMNADDTQQVQLTDNNLAELTSSWSLDGRKIIFHRQPAREVGEVRGIPKYQLWLINSDGTGNETQMTGTPGLNGFPSRGEARAKKNSR